MSTLYICFSCRQRALTSKFARQKILDCDRRDFNSLISSAKPGARPSAEVQRRKHGSRGKTLSFRARFRSMSQSVESRGAVDTMLENLFQTTQRKKLPLPLKSQHSDIIHEKLITEDRIRRQIMLDTDTLRGWLKTTASSEFIFRKLTTLGSIQEAAAGTILIHPEDATTRKLSQLLHNFLFRTLYERTKSESVPTPADTIELYMSNNLITETWWAQVFWQLYTPLLERLELLRVEGLEPFDRKSSYILGDIIEVWKLFCRSFGIYNQSLNVVKKPSADSCGEFGKSRSSWTQLTPGNDMSALGWIGLPEPMLDSSNVMASQRDFASHFGSFFAFKELRPYQQRDFAVLAMLTFTYLHLVEHVSILAQPITQSARPFLDFTREVMSNALSNESAIREMFKIRLIKHRILPPAIDQLYYDWQRLCGGTRREPIHQVLERPNDNTKSQPEGLHGNARPFQQDDGILLGSLRKAVREANFKFALKLWLRYLSDIEAGKRADDGLFAEFLSAFFALGSPKRAIEAWNKMPQYGCKPTGRHWVALLEGCKRNRDLTSLKSIWQKIDVAKIQRTNQLWTVYISGLLACKDWTTALEAVRQMVGDWRSSPQRDAPKRDVQVSNEASNVNEMDQLTPSIVPINAAISGLVALEKPELADELLKWAISQNISPDTLTFNTILRPAVRGDESDKVLRILQDMRSHACKPDVATFTLMLDGLVRNPSSAFHTASPSSQKELIDRILQDMKENSIEPNVRTYSVILDALLDPKNHNLPAARSVLARMDAENIKPTPHIYTMLITHYFSTIPPSLPAIESLWHRIEHDDIPLDHVFYDRMIEGYARLGAIDMMLSFLRRMPTVGKFPGWLALLEAVQALAKAEEWELVQELVRDVESQRGVGKLGMRGWRGKEEFWSVVRELKGRGLLDARRGARKT